MTKKIIKFITASLSFVIFNIKGLFSNSFLKKYILGKFLYRFFSSIYTRSILFSYNYSKEFEAIMFLSTVLFLNISNYIIIEEQIRKT